MKPELFQKMEELFPCIEHRYQRVGPIEMTLCRLARGNTFNMRVVGLEGIKRFRDKHPDCAITFKPNHLSEADFILLSMLFHEHDLPVLVEGGANLFLDHIDIYKDILPLFVDERFQGIADSHRLSLADYLCTRGAFKVFREPQTVLMPDGTEVSVGKKDMLMLSQAYRQRLVEQKQMYVTFPGYSSVKTGFMDLIKKDDIKTGRSYTGRFDGFHHLPFQMDIEASLATGVTVYVVDVNVAYSPVIEDENFVELLRLQESGANKGKIYLQDLGYIVEAFCRDKRKGELSIKFGTPVKIKTSGLKEPFMGMKIKNAAKTLASETFQKTLAMQPIFPANIFFSAFDDQFKRISTARMLERIDDLRDQLRHLAWGKNKWQVDLHYVLNYRNHVISADEIIDRTFKLFSTPQKHITDRDGDMFVVYNNYVAMQYRNHVAHFFETPDSAKEK